MTNRSSPFECSRGPPHDDVIKWKHFPRYWPFVRGIHRSPVNSPRKGQWRGALMFSCKQWRRWWFETQSRSLWRHRNVVGVKPLSGPLLEYLLSWTLRNKLQWYVNRNSYIFIQEKAFENVVWKWCLFYHDIIVIQITNVFFTVTKNQWQFGFIIKYFVVMKSCTNNDSTCTPVAYECIQVILSNHMMEIHWGMALLQLLLIRCSALIMQISLQWRHNERVGISNHRRPDCLHSRLLSSRSK